jgi:hypothetical protein
MSNLCKQCQVILTENNTYPSDWKSGARVCKNCRKNNYKINISSEQEKTYCQIKTLNIKKETLIAYGNKCDCCEQDIWQFLAVDHIDGLGGEHRKSIGTSGGKPFFYWLKSHAFPKDNFKILCHNCNCSLGFYGFCPHSYVQDLENCLICGNVLLDNIFDLHAMAGVAICQSCIIDKSPKRKTAKNEKINGSSLLQRRVYQKKHSFSLKKKIINGYGDKCACCGENNLLFLTIDHINCDGAEERKSEGYNQDKFYNSLIDNNFPNQYQLLCYNCNLCRGFYGKCYHQLCIELQVDDISISEYKDIIRES